MTPGPRPDGAVRAGAVDSRRRGNRIRVTVPATLIAAVQLALRGMTVQLIIASVLAGVAGVAALPALLLAAARDLGDPCRTTRKAPSGGDEQDWPSHGGGDERQPPPASESKAG